MWLAAAAILFGVTFGLLIAEVPLRLGGHQPRRPLVVEANEPTMNEPDPEIGWRIKPGAYVFPGYAPKSPPIRITLLPEGTRTTGTGGNRAALRVAFVGCSITMGWAISDEETFAWRVQQRFPSLRILNYGTGGYGSYQSLLLLERIFARPDAPQAVVYGFIQHHESRNVADPSWLRLLSTFSRRGTVGVPYCTLDDDGQLVRHPPARYPEWPLHRSLASVAFLEQRYAEFWGKARRTRQRAVTDRLLLAMRDLTERHGARFTVAVLQVAPLAKIHYERLLAEHNIDFVDCAYPIDPSMKVPGEGHPNGRMHARWAECIGDKIAALLPLAPTHSPLASGARRSLQSPTDSGLCAR